MNAKQKVQITWLMLQSKSDVVLYNIYQFYHFCIISGRGCRIYPQCLVKDEKFCSKVHIKALALIILTKLYRYFVLALSLGHMGHSYLSTWAFTMNDTVFRTLILVGWPLVVSERPYRPLYLDSEYVFFLYNTNFNVELHKVSLSIS